MSWSASSFRPNTATWKTQRNDRVPRDSNVTMSRIKIVVVFAVVAACAWFAWSQQSDITRLTGELSGARQALAERGLRRYYQTAFDDGYVPRVMPYVWRIIWTVGGLMAVTAVLPTNTGRPAFDALVVFSTWYPIGVMLLVFASRPLGRLIRQRAQERRK